MQLSFSLAEIFHLALSGVEAMEVDNPGMPELVDARPHVGAIIEALAMTNPKCLADYTVTLDIMDTFEP